MSAFTFGQCVAQVTPSSQQHVQQQSSRNVTITPPQDQHHLQQQQAIVNHFDLPSPTYTDPNWAASPSTPTSSHLSVSSTATGTPSKHHHHQQHPRGGGGRLSKREQRLIELQELMATFDRVALEVDENGEEKYAAWAQKDVDRICKAMKRLKGDDVNHDHRYSHHHDNVDTKELRRMRYEVKMNSKLPFLTDHAKTHPYLKRKSHGLRTPFSRTQQQQQPVIIEDHRPVVDVQQYRQQIRHLEGVIESMARQLSSKHAAQRKKRADSDDEVSRLRERERKRQAATEKKLETLHSELSAQRHAMQKLKDEQIRMIANHDDAQRKSQKNLDELLSKHNETMRELTIRLQRAESENNDSVVSANARCQALQIQVDQLTSRLTSSELDLQRANAENDSLKHKLIEWQSTGGANERGAYELQRKYTELVDYSEQQKAKLVKLSASEHDLKCRVLQLEDALNEATNRGTKLPSIALQGAVMLYLKKKYKSWYHLERQEHLKTRSDLADERKKLATQEECMRRQRLCHHDENSALLKRLQDAEKRSMELEQELLQWRHRPVTDASSTTQEIMSLKAQLARLLEEKRLSDAMNNTSIEPELMQYAGFLKTMFSNDSLLLNSNNVALSKLHQHGNETLLFSDYARTKGKKAWFGGSSECILAITSHAMYLLEVKSYKIRTRVLIQDLQSLGTSRKNAEVLIVRDVAASDTLVTCTKRPEVVYHLMSQFTRLTRGKLRVQVSEHMVLNTENMKYRSIEVSNRGRINISKHHLLAPNTPTAAAPSSPVNSGA